MTLKYADRNNADTKHSAVHEYATIWPFVKAEGAKEMSYETVLYTRDEQM